MSAKSKSGKGGITPKRAKSKTQAEPVSEPPSTPLKQVALNFLITSVTNLIEYSKKVKIYDYVIEATHQNLKLLPLEGSGSGEIYVCPCDDDNDEPRESLTTRVSTDVCDKLAAGDNEDNVTLSIVPDSQDNDFIKLDYGCKVNIDPTNLEDVNKLVDSPLLLTLYQIREITPQPTPKITIEEPEIVSLKTGKSAKSRKASKNKQPSIIETIEVIPNPEVTKTALGYACIDLMGLVNGTNVNETQQIYIYPIRVQAEFKTPIATVVLKSEEPLCQLNEKCFCKTVTFTLENIFNLPEFAFSPTIDISIDISLITKYAPEGNHETMKLVTFSHGKMAKHKPNDLFRKWNGLGDVNCIGLMTKLEVIDNFIGVYNLENIDLSFINDESYTIRFNSISRQLLTREMCIELEHLINYNEQQIMAEIHFKDNGQYNEELQKEMQFIYVGTADVAPLLFPEVSSGRFVISIKKLDRPEPPVSPKAEKKDRQKKVPQTKIPNSMSITTRETKSLETLPTRPTGVLRLRKEPTLEDVDSELMLKDAKYCVASLLEMPLIGEEMFMVLEIAFDTPVTEMPMEAIHTATRNLIGNYVQNYLFPLRAKQSIRSNYKIDSSINFVPAQATLADKETDFKLAAEAIEAEFEEEIVKIFKELPFHLEVTAFLNSNNPSDIDEKIKSIPFLRDMRANMVNTVMKLVAVKYNYCRLTTDHEHFKDLLSVVYNDLTEKIMRAANDFFAGNDNRLELKERERKDLHIFLAKEFRELNYKGISDYIFKQKLNDPTDFEETLVDLAINDLEELQFAKANLKIKELLVHSPKNLYGLIIQAYVEYKENGIAEVYPHLLNIIKMCPENVEIWSLLYGLYKKHNYRPGYKHCKMMLEKNCAVNLNWLPFFSTRKEPYFDAHFSRCAPHNCIYIFLKLGTYEFAEILYDTLKERFKEKEQIILKSSIYLLKKENELGLENLKNFRIASSNEMIMRLYKGHFLYAMDKELDGIREYQVVFHSPESKIVSQIAFLRCGFYDIKEKKFRKAKTYFAHCAKSMGTFLSWYGLGICFFRGNQYAEAEISFSKATNLYQPFAEVWVYLAMVNLQLDKKQEAIICFDTARKHNVKDKELWDEMVNYFHEKHIPLPTLF